MRKKQPRRDDFGEALNEEISSPTSNSNDEYYKLAREQEFDQLLNKEIQLENAKNNALKHTETDLASMGLNNTGYGSSTQAGIFNNFLNSLVSAKNQTDANVNNINMEQIKQQEIKDNNRFENFTALMAKTHSREELNDLFVDYGFGSLGEDGSLVIGEKPENISDDDWLQFKAVYRNQVGKIDKDKAEEEAFKPQEQMYYAPGELKSLSYIDEDGKTRNLGEEGDFGFIEESNKLFENADNGVYQDGDVIKVENWKGHIVFLKYNDGGFSMINRKQYNDGENKRYLKGKGKNKFEEK